MILITLRSGNDLVWAWGWWSADGKLHYRHPARYQAYSVVCACWVGRESAPAELRAVLSRLRVSVSKGGD